MRNEIRNKFDKLKIKFGTVNAKKMLRFILALSVLRCFIKPFKLRGAEQRYFDNK